MNVYQYKTGNFAAAIKDVSAKEGIVSGYFSAFDNVDADGDIIRMGAFSKTIQEQGPDSAHPRIKHLMNHDINLPLGKLMILKEDATGLYYESKVGTHTLGQDYIKMVESGLITEHSIGFRTVKRNQLQDYEGYQKNPSGGWFEITEVKLYEGSSLTAWGANSMTPIVALKGMTIEQQLEKMLQRSKSLEKFCRNSTATDETIELLLIEQKQLTQLIVDMQKEATKSHEGTLPEVSIDDIRKAFSNFTNQLK